MGRAETILPCIAVLSCLARTSIYWTTEDPKLHIELSKDRLHVPANAIF